MPSLPFDCTLLFTGWMTDFVWWWMWLFLRWFSRIRRRFHFRTRMMTFQLEHERFNRISGNQTRKLPTCLRSLPLERRSAKTSGSYLLWKKRKCLPEWSVDGAMLSITVRFDWIEFETTTGRCSFDTVTVLFIDEDDISTTLVIVYMKKIVYRRTRTSSVKLLL